MLISEIAKLIKDKKLNKTETIRIRHPRFEPGEYLEVDCDEYPHFYSNWVEGNLIEWYPSLDDLIADDWEVVETILCEHDNCEPSVDHSEMICLDCGESMGPN